MSNDKVLIYGANGYTGRLITQVGVEKGLKPVLAGRNKDKISDLARKYDLDCLVFDLDDTSDVSSRVAPFNIVLHCAGPFSKTARPMINACLNSQTHYLDITGEIEVFEYAASKNEEAKNAGILLMPGVGFDVVPSDCLASYLSSKLPDATHLQLAFKGSGGISRGTAMTMMENIHKGGAIRENGKIKKVPAAFRTKRIKFPSKEYLAATIPWGDVSTAYYSTGIPNIEVYTATPKKMVTLMMYTNYLGWMLKTEMVKKYMRRKIDRKITGPSHESREQGKSELWGMVSNGERKFEASLVTPEGYSLTAVTAVGSVERLLIHDVFSGFKTPSMAFGPDFILEFEGTSRADI